MENLILGIHYVFCFFLIIVILLQVGKGADLGAAFGGASQTVFGGRGPATFLNKMTAIVAICFLFTSLGLSYISKTRLSSSVIDNMAIPVQTQIQPEAAAPTAAPEKPAEAAPASPQAPAGK